MSGFCAGILYFVQVLDFGSDFLKNGASVAEHAFCRQEPRRVLGGFLGVFSGEWLDFCLSRARWAD